MMSVCIAMGMAAALAGCAVEPDPAGEASEPVVRSISDGLFGNSPCPDGAVCLYQDPDRGGMMIVLTGGARLSDLRTIPCPGCINGTIGNDGTFDKQMSSWDNRSAISNCHYEKPNCGGQRHVMRAHEFHNASPSENDIASSVEPCGPPAQL